MERNIDKITRTYTGFPSFDELLNAKGGYRPSIGTGAIDCHAGERTWLADEYDRAQAERGDNRRAYRY